MSKNLMITKGDLGSAPKNAKKRPAVRLSTLDERDSKRAKMTTVAAPSRKNDTKAAARLAALEEFADDLKKNKRALRPFFSEMVLLVNKQTRSTITFHRSAAS
jgi:hypothetical protein